MAVTRAATSKLLSTGLFQCNDFVLFQNEAVSWQWTITDQDDAAVSLENDTPRFVAHRGENANDASTYFAVDGTVSGASFNVLTFAFTAVHTARVIQVCAFTLWNVTDSQVVGRGALSILPAPQAHA